MRCAWQAYINLIPHRMRSEIDRQGRGTLQELRLRTNLPAELCFQWGSRSIQGTVAQEDIDFVINAASKYSPWAAGTVSQGFLTAAGGHRIGICGVSTVSQGRVCGISNPTSLCIRVARDFSGIAKPIADLQGSVLIIGPPGSGKTTLLRDFIRCKSDLGVGSVSVVDEREELFPLFEGQACFAQGEHTDILSRCPKAEGIEMVLRTMNPAYIAVDEITSENDCKALLHAGWCGVHLLATAHAGSIADLKSRPVYSPLIANKLFSHIIVLRKDKSWIVERI